MARHFDSLTAASRAPVAEVTRLLVRSPKRDKLPSAITKLVALEELTIDMTSRPGARDHNPRFDWSDAFEKLAELPKLRWLSLFDCRARALPESIGRLRALKFLNAFQNELTAIPEAVCTLPLETLILDDNPITRLPDALGDLQALGTLGLGRAALTELPASFARLSALRRLDLDYNPFPSFPPPVAELHALEHLRLGGTSMPRIGTSLSKMRALSHLVIRTTQDPAVELTQLPALAELHYQFYGKPRALPDGVLAIPSLRKLSLFESYLESFPREITALPELRALDLRENRIPSLPPEIGRLESLEFLELRKNPISALPPEIGRLTKLRHLGVDKATFGEQVDSLRALLPQAWIGHDGHYGWSD